jgi:Icc-related predicted phosphoesterase
MRAKETDLQIVETNSAPLQLDVKYSDRLVAKIKQQEKEYVVHFFYHDESIVQKASLITDYDSVIDSILDWIREPICTLVHISDTHSTFPKLPGTDEIVVCSGDFFPNSTRGIREIEENYQTQWLIENLPTFKKWIGNRKFLFCSGNHDFIDPCRILQQEGIRAVNITNTWREHNGISFYGFPYIPWIAGEWNYECHVPEMQRNVAKLKEVIATKGVDVLVAHCPPYGILDADFVIKDDNNIIVPKWAEHCGNRSLTNLLSYEMEEIPRELRPRYLLCGHMHGHYGRINTLGVTISQAATRTHVVEIEL